MHKAVMAGNEEAVRYLLQELKMDAFTQFNSKKYTGAAEQLELVRLRVHCARLAAVDHDLTCSVRRAPNRKDKRRCTWRCGAPICQARWPSSECSSTPAQTSMQRPMYAPRHSMRPAPLT